MTEQTKNRGTQSLLRQAARDAVDAAIWLERFEQSGRAEHRLNATRCLMDARDALRRAEVCVTEGLDERIFT